MMIRHPSSSEVVTERAFRIPKLIWQVAAAIYCHPESNMQAIQQVPERSPGTSSASLVSGSRRTDAFPTPPTQRNRRGLSPSFAVGVCDPHRLSSPRSFHRATLSSALSLTVRRDLGQQKRARWRRDPMYVPHDDSIIASVDVTCVGPARIFY